MVYVSDNIDLDAYRTLSLRSQAYPVIVPVSIIVKPFRHMSFWNLIDEIVLMKLEGGLNQIIAFVTGQVFDLKQRVMIRVMKESGLQDRLHTLLGLCSM